MKKEIKIQKNDYMQILKGKSIELSKFLELANIKNIEEFNFKPFYKLVNIDNGEYKLVDLILENNVIKVEPKELSLENFDTFVFDMDGTLLDAKKNIVPNNLQALKELALKGKNICIATGRAIFMLDNYLDQIPYNLPFLCANGGMVYDHKTFKMISDFNIKHEDAIKLMDKCDELKLGYYIFWEGGFVGNNVENSQDYKSKDYTKIMKPQYWKLNPGRSFYDDKEICKILVTFDPHQSEDIAKFDKYVKEFPTLLGIQTQKNFYDVGEPSSKALALASIADKYKINLKRTVAFGDANNDAPTFEYAALSFAPLNSMELALENATFVSQKTSDEDWIADIIWNKLQ
ncbi:Cof-type HAD-IIB family hydrolase [Mycoplasmopsis mucosicanis]|uniref:Cof-type HAD-IIB family hydrolase n=1 Tax=Mycoplasmopsis mucosicanis TaxID=458208 RepID=A0A507SHJ4_9BACT|nr:Cof-type HAD-IIB family hydrolase [Mycoplasmopsis mucosicanis]TQC51329.1 Cof-type HAD-IIB family hydrolase [Mycoplasmopsis mucosicanis]